jgi:hypothetical protein
MERRRCDGATAAGTKVVKNINPGIGDMRVGGVVATVRARKIVHTMVYPTPQEVLEAVGLRE